MSKVSTIGKEMAKGKIRIKENGEQSGKSFLSSFKFPAATAPALALILIGVLLGDVGSMSGTYTNKLVEYSIGFCFMFMIMVLGGLGVVILLDLSAISRSNKSFSFSPAEAVVEDLELQKSRIDEE